MEGAGVYEFQNWLKALFWFTVAGLVVQEALSAFPPVAAAVSLFWAFFAFLLSLLGVYVSENNQANPAQYVCPSRGAWFVADHFQFAWIGFRSRRNRCLRGRDLGI